MGEVAGRKLRPHGWHIEAAVAGKPGQQHILEAEFRGLAPG